MHHLGKEEGKGGRREGGREGRGGREEGEGRRRGREEREGGEGTVKEERKEKEDCGETTGRLPRTKGTEEVLNVVCRHLLWKCHQEHMLPRYWSCEGVRECEGGKGIETT